MIHKISKNEKYEYRYTSEYESVGEYVVQVFSNYSGNFIRCLFFNSKEAAFNFIKIQ